MTMDATIKWKLPTQRESGKPLKKKDIDHSSVQLASAAGEFAELDQVKPPKSELFVPDLSEGEWTARVIIVDANGKPAKPADLPFVVDSSPPGSALEVTVDLS